MAVFLSFLLAETVDLCRLNYPDNQTAWRLRIVFANR